MKSETTENKNQQEEMLNENPKGRIVAIVGRPNVGKSAIFNRLARKRIAIVHEESGVTRDRLIREVRWEEEEFELIDTGGIAILGHERSSDLFDLEIKAQVEVALQDAVVAILVVDIQVGLKPMDEVVAKLLRENGIVVVLVANKADEPKHEVDSIEFDCLGFPVIPFSALHNRGVGELMELVVPHLPKVENKTIKEPLRVAIIGRPNVGKSSYVNRLLCNDRVIVSDISGTTRDSIDVPFVVGSGPTARHYTLVDTAGLRKVTKIDNAVERFSHFRSEQNIDDADVVVLMLDSTTGPTSHDKRIASKIKEAGKGCLMLVNKWDLTEETQRKFGPELMNIMPFMSHCPVVFISAKTGYNIRRSIEGIDFVAAQTQLDLPTGMLNRVLKTAFERSNPPRRKGKALKIYYATQVGKAPQVVRVYVNDPRIVTANYRTYLVKRLREAVGLEGAALWLQFRGRQRDDNVYSKAKLSLSELKKTSHTDRKQERRDRKRSKTGTTNKRRS